MKQEMKELQELNNSFSFQGNEKVLATNEVTKLDTSSNLKFCDDKVEESLFGLLAETESLKHTLLQQRKTLSTLLNDVMLGRFLTIFSSLDYFVKGSFYFQMFTLKAKITGWIFVCFAPTLEHSPRKILGYYKSYLMKQKANKNK